MNLFNNHQLCFNILHQLGFNYNNNKTKLLFNSNKDINFQNKILSLSNISTTTKTLAITANSIKFAPKQHQYKSTKTATKTNENMDETKCIDTELGVIDN